MTTTVSLNQSKLLYLNGIARERPQERTEKNKALQIRYYLSIIKDFEPYIDSRIDRPQLNGQIEFFKLLLDENVGQEKGVNVSSWKIVTIQKVEEGIKSTTCKLPASKWLEISIKVRHLVEGVIESILSAFLRFIKIRQR